jgi:hypothetical protein
MKRLLNPNVILMAGVVGWLVLIVAAVKLAADEPKGTAPVVTKMAEADQYHLRALNAELDVIQTQINELARQLKAGEKVNEKNLLLAKVCGAAKIPVEKCQPNTDTGEVTAKPDSPPQAPATPPKK